MWAMNAVHGNIYYDKKSEDEDLVAYKISGYAPDKYDTMTS